MSVSRLNVAMSLFNTGNTFAETSDSRQPECEVDGKTGRDNKLSLLIRKYIKLFKLSGYYMYQLL